MIGRILIPCHYCFPENLMAAEEALAPNLRWLSQLLDLSAAAGKSVVDELLATTTPQSWKSGILPLLIQVACLSTIKRKWAET